MLCFQRKTHGGFVFWVQIACPAKFDIVCPCNFTPAGKAATELYKVVKLRRDGICIEVRCHSYCRPVVSSCYEILESCLEWLGSGLSL